MGSRRTVVGKRTPEITAYVGGHVRSLRLGDAQARALVGHAPDDRRIRRQFETGGDARLSQEQRRFGPRRIQPLLRFDAAA
jgi:hypothetical protein